MSASHERKIFRPKENDPCLCGSGMTFHACCANHLPGFDQGKKVDDFCNSKNWDAALIAARSDFTQYAIWHKTNTEPVMAAPVPNIQYLLWVDIQALGDMAGTIASLYLRLDRQAELPAVFERLRPRVNDIRWQRKITYYQTLFAEMCGDETVARAEFSKLEPILDDERDVEILQLYMDICGAELSFEKRLRVCDWILKLSDSAGDHLQYRGLKGFSYAEIGQTETAVAEFKAGIDYAHERADENKLSLRARHFLAASLSMYALFTRDAAAFEEAEAILKELIAEPDAWTEDGRADLYENLGECYRYWRKWEEGQRAYRSAIAIRPRDIDSVFLAECLLRQGCIEDASTTLESVAFDALSKSEKVDYAYTMASVAVESKDRTRLAPAIACLKSVEISSPIFQERRLKLIIELQSTFTTSVTPRILDRLRKLLADPLRTISRYTILQPTIFGMGLNINAVLEDFGKSKSKSDKPQDDQ